MAKSIINSEITNNENLRKPLSELQSAVVDMAMTDAGLTIGTSANTAVKIANSVYAFCNGIMTLKTTAEVAFTATTHDVTADAFRIFVLSLASDGTVTITAGTEGASLALATLPVVPSNEAILGFVIINPTGTGDFDAGTTALDDGTVVPNAVYQDCSGAPNPNAIALG